MSELDAGRIVPTEGIFNFRDYVGKAADDSGTLRRRLLYRSTQHMDASDDDLDVVASLDLKGLIDFRGASASASACAVHPYRLHPDFGTQVIMAEGQAAMRGMYETMPTEPVIVSLFRNG